MNSPGEQLLQVVQSILNYEVIRLLQIDIDDKVKYFSTTVRSPSGKFTTFSSKFVLEHNRHGQLRFILQQLLCGEHFYEFDFSIIDDANDWILDNINNFSDSALIKSIEKAKVQPNNIALEISYHEISKYIHYYFRWMDAGLKTELISRLLARLWHDTNVVTISRITPTVKPVSIAGYTLDVDNGPFKIEQWDQINKAIYDNMELLDEIENYVIAFILNVIINEYNNIV